MSDVGETLDSIRRTELAAARRVQEARDRADAILAAAHTEARTIRAKAQRAGRERAQQHLTASVAAAEEEAAQVRRRGEEAAQQLLASGPVHVGTISDAMVAAVLAPPVEEGR